MIEKLTKDLKKYLYHNNQELTEIDKISFQKALFTLLRECIKQKEYDIEIGSYHINLNPLDTIVEYENDDTSVRITKNDAYYETTRETEIRYFIPDIIPSFNDTYGPESPVIKVSGLVDNIAGDCTESYSFELFNIDEDISTYLNIPENMEISSAVPPTKYNIILKRNITRNDKRLDVIKIFKENKVVPVIYNPKLDKYVKTSYEKEYNPDNYSSLIPDLTERKNIVSFIYSQIVEFYDLYLNNN